MGFTQWHGGRLGYSLLHIRKSGQVGFSKSAAREFSLNAVDRITLHFDREKDIIGIQLDGESIKLSHHPRIGHYFTGQSFLRCFGINFKKSKRYPLTKDPETGYLVAHIGK